MNAIILSIGDELVLGQSLDTNSQWLSRPLVAVGCDVSEHLTVPDHQRSIERTIHECSQRCDFLVITGGIGPTADDLTRQALAVVMRQELELSEAWLAKLEEFFRVRGRPMPESNRIQAMIPTGARMINNDHGTAAGIDAKLTVERLIPGHSPRPHECRVFVMPGVPKEMMPMFETDVLPHIQQAGGGAAIVSKSLHTFGRGESSVAEQLGALMDRSRNPSVGTTVSGGIVTLRINSRFKTVQEATQQLEDTAQQCRAILGDLIWGEDDQTLQAVVGKMLSERKLEVATAESCTGGLLAKLITDVPGSSDYFTTGFITYSNRAKYERLGVSMEIINVFGAVSEKVVEAMASNARRLAKADIALAISGVAGPGGGSEAKPVGTVCIALSHEAGVIARQFFLPGDREWVRDRSAKTALAMLRFHLLGREMPF